MRKHLHNVVERRVRFSTAVLLATVTILVSSCTKKYYVDKSEYRLHDATEMLKLQNMIDNSLANDFSLRQSPLNVEGPWAKALHFIHTSDVQLRDVGITLVGKRFSKFADYIAGGAKRHPLLDANDHSPFLALVGALNKSANKPTFLLHTGDAIDAGSMGEAIAFVSIANRLTIPWFNAIGNHDVLFFGTFTNSDVKIENPRGEVEPTFGRRNFMRLHGPNDLQYTLMNRWASHQETETFPIGAGAAASFRHGFDVSNAGVVSPPYLIRSEGWYSVKVNDAPAIRMLILDTTVPDERVLGIGELDAPMGAEGWITNDQFTWLERELATAYNAREHMIVAGHHPLQDSLPSTKKKLQGVIDNQRGATLKDYLLMQPHVLAYLGGHTHYGYINKHEGPRGILWEIVAPSLHEFPQLALSVTIYQAGTRLGMGVEPVAGRVNNTSSELAQSLQLACKGSRIDTKREADGECWQEDSKVKRFLELRSGY